MIPDALKWSISFCLLQTPAQNPILWDSLLFDESHNFLSYPSTFQLRKGLPSLEFTMACVDTMGLFLIGWMNFELQKLWISFRNFCHLEKEESRADEVSHRPHPFQEVNWKARDSPFPAMKAMSLESQSIPHSGSQINLSKSAYHCRVCKVR